MQRLEPSKEVPIKQRLLCSSVTVITEDIVKVKKVSARKDAPKGGKKVAAAGKAQNSKKIKKRKKKPTKDERKILKMQRRRASLAGQT